MKRSVAAQNTHDVMLKGKYISATNIGEFSNHRHPANQVIDYLRHKMFLPVHNMGWDNKGETCYGYVNKDIELLKTDKPKVQAMMKLKNQKKRSRRHVHNVEIAVKELGFDVVFDIIKELDPCK